jgi:uncharacterized membrane protein
LTGAIGLLILRLAWLAAAGLAADMAGASIISVAVLHSPAVAMAVPLCIAFTLIGRARRMQARKATGQKTRHARQLRSRSRPKGAPR